MAFWRRDNDRYDHRYRGEPPRHPREQYAYDYDLGEGFFRNMGRWASINRPRRRYGAEYDRGYRARPAGRNYGYDREPLYGHRYGREYGPDDVWNPGLGYAHNYRGPAYDEFTWKGGTRQRGGRRRRMGYDTGGWFW